MQLLWLIYSRQYHLLFWHPKRLLCGSGTRFVNTLVEELLDDWCYSYEDKPILRLGNGSATNKIMHLILNRMVYDESKRRKHFLSLDLLAYHISKHTSTQERFSLYYMRSSDGFSRCNFFSSTVLASKLFDPHYQIYDTETLEERRYNAENKWPSKHNAYNNKLRPRTWRVGDLVLNTIGHVQKVLSA